MLSKIGMAAVELEAVAGTAETIVAADAIYAEEFKVTIDQDMRERAVLRTVPDSLTPKPGGVKSSVSGSFELLGSGTAGTAPGVLSDLLQAVGMSVASVATYRSVFTLDSDLAGIGSITAKEFRDGKYHTAKGVRGSAVFNLKAGEIGKVQFEGQGAFEASGDAAVVANPSNSRTPPVMVSADMFLLETLTDYLAEDLDGNGETLNAAAANEKLAFKIVKSGAKQLKFVALNLKGVGAPSGNITLTIQGDDAAAPDGSAITNGTATVLAAGTVSTTAGWYVFTFPTPPTLADGTTYWAVLTPGYAGSDTDNVLVDTDVVLVGEQASMAFTTAGGWAAISLENISAILGVATTAALNFDGMELDLGQEVSVRTDPNDDKGYDQAVITGRNVSLNLAPLEKTDALRNFYSYLTGETDLFFYCKLGATAGNRFEFFMPHLKASMAGNWEDRDAEVTHPVNLHVEDPEDFYLFVS